MRREASGREVGTCYWFLSIGDMIMDQKMEETLRQITELNEDEKFYKAYFQAGKSEEALRQFLKGVDREDAVRRLLSYRSFCRILFPIIWTTMNIFPIMTTEIFLSADITGILPALPTNTIFLKLSMCTRGNVFRISG